MIRKLTALVFALAISLPALASTPVNVNTADAATIAASLDGVGMTKAQAIVTYRKAHGAFKSANQLASVKGIGPATLKRNSSAIRLSGSLPPPAKPAHHRTSKAHKAK